MSTLIEIKNLSKSYFQQPLFSKASLSINVGQKIGVIGRNGAGKSTLFKVLLGEEEQDSGSVIIHDRTRLGYIEQHDVLDVSEPVIAYLEKATHQPVWECAKVGAQFDFTPAMLEQPIETFSGGFQMRIKLIALLLKDPNLFLLDEPTNYLDVQTQLLLEQALISYSGAFLIISHDREFLERTCDMTLEVEHEKLFLYPGDVAAYFDYKREQLVMKEAYNKKIDREQKHLQSFVDRFRYKASKASQAQSKLKALTKLKKLDIADPLARVRITIPGVEAKKGVAFSCNKLSIGYGEKTVASNATFDIDRGAKVAIVGANGQGKTTLLKTLVDELPPLGGTFRWGHGTSSAYYAQHIASRLPNNELVWDYLRTHADSSLPDETVLQMAGNFLFHASALEKKISVLSGGERARLCLASLLLTKSNVLILDEPTNHLDFETVEALAAALADYAGTVFFISHNRTFVNSLATLLIEVKNGVIRRYPDSYENYIYSLGTAAVETQTTPKTSTDTPDKEAAKQKHEAMKILKKRSQSLEKEMLRLTSERDRLLARQAKRPEKFLATDYELLSKIIHELEAAEEAWLQIAEKQN